MKIKLWIDDRRLPPDWSWAWAVNSWQAIQYLHAACKIGGPTIEFISFDHDLGGNDTAMSVADELEWLVHIGEMRMPEWQIHSSNPPGRLNLMRALRSAERFEAAWEERLRQILRAA